MLDRPKIIIDEAAIETEIRELLAERGHTHGDYALQAGITQAIKRVLYANYTAYHTDTMRDAAEMIAVKLGRILAGDPDFRDHWDDISGYAKLVADRCSK